MLSYFSGFAAGSQKGIFSAWRKTSPVRKVGKKTAIGKTSNVQ